MAGYPPITKEKLKTHFHYNLWKYIILVVVCALGWNLLYTTTRYRTPPERKLEFYVDGMQTAETDAAMKAMLERVHTQVVPDMEEVSYTVLTSDETYGMMQLTIWISAGQGDVYLLLEERFQGAASAGAMVDLSPYMESGLLNAEGLDLSAGLVTNPDTGVKGQYGIPADDLPGLNQLGLASENAVLCVVVGTGNEDACIRFLNDLLVNMR